jgi:hypothetical protein
MLVGVGDLVRSPRRLPGTPTHTGDARWRLRLDVDPIAGQSRLICQNNAARVRSFKGANLDTDAFLRAKLAKDLDCQTKIGGRAMCDRQRSATPDEREQRDQEWREIEQCMAKGNGHAP